MYYFSITVTLPTSRIAKGRILTENKFVAHEADLEVSKCRHVLNKSGIIWSHAYYWPGDHYYAFAKSKSKKQLIAQLKKAAAAGLVEIKEIPPGYKTYKYKNATVASLMKRKAKSFTSPSLYQL